MKLNEFLKTYDLKLKINVNYKGDYCCDFSPTVEISDGMFLTSAWGKSSKDIKTAIENTLKNVSNKTLKINNEKYVSVFEVEL